MDSHSEPWRREGQYPSTTTGPDPVEDPGRSREADERTGDLGVPGSSPPPGSPQRPGGPRGGPGWLPLIGAVLIAALVASVVTYALVRPGEGDDTTELAERNQDSASDERPAEGGPSIPEVADSVLPSVAQVDVQGLRGAGSGSAVVYSEDGLLVTNNHVVEGAQRIEVQLGDATRYEAEIVGNDPRSDLALLRIDSADLPVPAFASDTPDRGETAIAIGSPFGLDGTVTAGIVSATERLLLAERGVLVGLIQTDAAINPGNSGGALVNGVGELIGINTAIFSRVGENSGIGFAIPTDTVLSVAEDLAAGREVEYAFLGISPVEITGPVAERLGTDTTRGALIAQVVEGSPAAEAGVQVGDIVIGIGDQEVTEPEDVFSVIREHSPGDETTLRLSRDGEEIEVEVTLGTAPTVP